MNQLAQRQKSMQVGFIFILIGDLFLSALYWLVGQTTTGTMEYWLRDMAFLLTKVGTVGLAIIVSIMLFCQKKKGEEAKELSLPIVLLITVPGAAVIAGAMTAKEWWIAILGYLVYASAIFGFSIARYRITTLSP